MDQKVDMIFGFEYGDGKDNEVVGRGFYSPNMNGSYGTETINSFDEMDENGRQIFPLRIEQKEMKKHAGKRVKVLYCENGVFDDRRNPIDVGVVTSRGSVYINNTRFQSSFKDRKKAELFADGSYFIGYFNGDFPRSGKMTYANKDVYEGGFEDGKRHGEGKMTYANKDVYEGQFFYGERHGKGKITYANKDVYEGQFKDGKRHGKGKMTYANGDVYEGQFKYDKKDGIGIYTSKGTVSLCHWSEDKKYGEEIFQQANGTTLCRRWDDGEITEESEIKDNKKISFTYYDGKYVGQFKDGKRHGKGKMTYANGDVYEGQFEDGKRHGEGKMTYANKDVYEGRFVRDSVHGKGKMIYENGDVYEGRFVDGERHGKGKMTYANKDVYEGQFEDGRRHGKGKMIYENGDVYEGEFKDGERHGKGKMTYTDGDVYEGGFEYDKKDGIGIYTSKGTVSLCHWSEDKKYGEEIFQQANGTMLRRRWDDGEKTEESTIQGNKKISFTYDDGKYVGQFKDGKRHGKGKMTYANGDVYEGQFEDGKRHGEGKMAYANKDVYEGQFKDDRMHGKGKMIYENGNVFEGEFKNGERHGKGKMTYTSGNVYEGEYKDGIPDGLQIRKKDGTVSLCHYSRGLQNGEEIFQQANGTTLCRRWDDGEITEESEIKDNKKISFTYYDGKYVGQFKDGKRHGKGKMTYANGDVSVGIWTGDKKNGKEELKKRDGTVLSRFWHKGALVSERQVVQDNNKNNNNYNIINNDGDIDSTKSINAEKEKGMKK